MRMERSALHHGDRALHDLGLIDAERERNPVIQGPEAKDGGEDENRRKPDRRRTQIAGFAPLALSHRFTRLSAYYVRRRAIPGTAVRLRLPQPSTRSVPRRSPGSVRPSARAVRTRPALRSTPPRAL